MSVMKRPLLVTFAVVAYAWFLADIVWSIAFLADAGGLGISHGASTPTLWAVLINLSLLGVFAMHHSVMAREGAKRRITRVIPAAAERSTYVLVAVALLALVLWVWRPIGGGGTVWDVSAQPWQLLLWLGYGLGWLVAVAATFMIDHADFVGLRQAASRPGHYRPPVFREQWLYAWVRHPLMLGLLIAFWLTPRMSLGHLLFAAASTAYIVIGIRLEEGALRRRYGSSYADYATRVPSPHPGTAASNAQQGHGGDQVGRDGDRKQQRCCERGTGGRRYGGQERGHDEHDGQGRDRGGRHLDSLGVWLGHPHADPLVWDSTPRDWNNRDAVCR